MPLASHDAFSTNWKSGCAGSKRQTRISDRPKGDQGGPQRDPACITIGRFVAASRKHIDEHRTEHRQESDDG